MKNAILPTNDDSEISILGACLLNPKIIPEINNIVSPEWFFSNPLKLLYIMLNEIRTELKDSNDRATIIISELNKRNLLEKVGGKDFLFAITRQVSGSAGWKYHAEQIKEMYQRRQLIMAGEEIVNHAYRKDVAVSDILSMGKLMVSDISKNKEIFKFDNYALYSNIYDNIYNKNSFMGHKLGIADIEYKLEPKTTTVIAAESGVGKSAISLQIADHIAQFGKVLYFTLESTTKSLAFRQVARKSKVALSRIRNSNIEYSSHDEQINKATNELVISNLWIIDNTDFSCIEKAISFCESISMDEKLELIVFDYLQLMYTIRQTSSRHLEISHVTRDLNSLAKNLDVPIIYVSQLTKNIDGERPRLSNLKESGDIRNNADNIIFLWAPDSQELKEYDVEMYSLKGKDQELFSQGLSFNGHYQLFVEGNKPTIQKKKSGWKDKKES